MQDYNTIARNWRDLIRPKKLDVDDLKALRDRFPGKLGESNTAAATAACEFVRERLEGGVHA